MRIEIRKTIYLWWVIVVALLLSSMIMALVTFQQRMTAERTWKQLLAGWQENVEKLSYPPTTKTILVLQHEYEWLRNEYDEMNKLLIAKKIDAERITPLEFKEKLLDAQLRFKQLAAIQNSKMPKSLGFSEYTGGRIPVESDVPVLHKQLLVIKGIVDLLLKNKVSEIIVIERFSEVEIANVYKELKIKIVLQCKLEQLLKILDELANSIYLTVVQTVEIEKLAENEVEVVLDIGIIDWNK